MEIYKDIIGFEGLYKISNLGNVFGIKRNKVLKNRINKTGYYQIKLTKNSKRKSFLIHRLIAIHFIPTDDFSLEVNHINADRKDFRIENLEWVTRNQNQKHSCVIGNNFRKLNKEKVEKIRLDNRKYKFISEEYGVSTSVICNIKKNKIHKHT